MTFSADEPQIKTCTDVCVLCAAQFQRGYQILVPDRGSKERSLPSVWSLPVPLDQSQSESACLPKKRGIHAASAMSRPPSSASSDHARWKSMPPGSHVYEQVLEGLLHSSRSSSSSPTSSSSSSSSCNSCCSCNDTCPYRYRVSAAAELVHNNAHRDDGGNLGYDLQTRLNLFDSEGHGQGKDFLNAPGHGHFDGIARSRSLSPRSVRRNLGQAIRPCTSHDGFHHRSQEVSRGHEKRGHIQSARPCAHADMRRGDGDVRICDFVEDLIRQGAINSSGMGNNASAMHDKRHGHDVHSSGDGHSHSLSTHNHKALPPITGQDKTRGDDSIKGASNSSDSRPAANHTSSHVTQGSGHIGSGLAAPGRVVASRGQRSPRSSSPLLDHKGDRDRVYEDHSLAPTDHPQSTHSRPLPRPGTPRGRLSPLPQRKETPDSVDSSSGYEEGASYARDGTSETRHTGRNGGSAHATSRASFANTGKSRTDRSPSSSPIPIPHLQNLHKLGVEHYAAQRHRSKQHVQLCTYNQEGIPSINVDEPDEDYPAGDPMRPRSMSDASGLHVRRRRQLPRPPLHAHRTTQDDVHVHVHWADERRGSPLATSVLLSSIRPRALSHGSVDLPKPILKKPFGF